MNKINKYEQITAKCVPVRLTILINNAIKYKQGRPVLVKHDAQNSVEAKNIFSVKKRKLNENRGTNFDEIGRNL